VPNSVATTRITSNAALDFRAPRSGMDVYCVPKVLRMGSSSRPRCCQALRRARSPRRRRSPRP
jgi:hypothetical protein